VASADPPGREGEPGGRGAGERNPRAGRRFLEGTMTSADEDPGARLMLAFAAGDEAAFERLVHDHSGRVWALLTRFLGPVSGREDLVQEVFLRVLRARTTYRPTARFSTWLYRIVFNLCANERERDRVRGPHLPLSPEEGGLEPPDRRLDAPDEDLERQDVVGAVRAAIDALPERQRMALILAKYEELPYVEIADVLGSSEKAIKSMIHRAREPLRGSLAPFLREEPA